MLRQVCQWSGVWNPGPSQAPASSTLTPQEQVGYSRSMLNGWRPQGLLWVSDVVLSKELWDSKPLFQVNGALVNLVTSKDGWYRFVPTPGPRKLQYRFGAHYVSLFVGDIVHLTLDNPTGFDVEGTVVCMGLDELESDEWLD